jgi:hypothetical protein
MQGEGDDRAHTGEPDPSSRRRCTGVSIAKGDLLAGILTGFVTLGREYRPIIAPRVSAAPKASQLPHTGEEQITIAPRTRDAT